MNIVILSRNANLYSTRRLVEEAEKRDHKVEIIDPLKCDIIIEKEKEYYNKGLKRIIEWKLDKKCKLF